MTVKMYFAGKPDAHARLRMLLETAALFLPPGRVHRAFQTIVTDR